MDLDVVSDHCRADEQQAARGHAEHAACTEGVAKLAEMRTAGDGPPESCAAVGPRLREQHDALAPSAVHVPDGMRVGGIEPSHRAHEGTGEEVGGRAQVLEVHGRRLQHARASRALTPRPANARRPRSSAGREPGRSTMTPTSDPNPSEVDQIVNGPKPSEMQRERTRRLMARVQPMRALWEDGRASHQVNWSPDAGRPWYDFHVSQPSQAVDFLALTALERELDQLIAEGRWSRETYGDLRARAVAALAGQDERAALSFIDTPAEPAWRTGPSTSSPRMDRVPGAVGDVIRRLHRGWFPGRRCSAPLGLSRFQVNQRWRPARGSCSAPFSCRPRRSLASRPLDLVYEHRLRASLSKAVASPRHPQ